VQIAAVAWLLAREMKEAKWPAPVMGGGGRRAPAPPYSLLATSPPTSISNDGCSPHYPPAASDDDAASSFEPPPPPQRHSPQLGVADWLRLQRQSSGSTDDGEGFPSVSTVANAECRENKANTGTGDPPPSSSSKSWAQQAEEAYQLQLALALRLCSDAASAADPNFLDSADPEHHHNHIATSPQSLSHRFWVCTHLSLSLPLILPETVRMCD
jgi:serine/threonine-protein kinase CTR1